MTSLEVAKKLMNRLLEEEPIVAEHAVRTHETQRQLTYQLCFINVDGDDFQDSLFSVYQYCRLQKGRCAELFIAYLFLTPVDLFQATI